MNNAFININDIDLVCPGRRTVLGAHCSISSSGSNISPIQPDCVLGLSDLNYFSHSILTSTQTELRGGRRWWRNLKSLLSSATGVLKAGFQLSE